MSNATVMRVDKLAGVMKAVTALASKSVYVGVPDSGKNERKDGGPINNATIGYIMEYGSPAANIPARPHLLPGVQGSREEWLPELQQAAAAALRGDPSKVNGHLQRAGIVASQAVKMKISEGIPPPLADSTVKARARRGRKGARDELVNRAVPEIGASTELVKPLIDTGQYRNSITYVVK